MGVVKYTGPMASFHCPTNAEIRSLKVHFSPKQEGSGDPSPENVREIVGWDGVSVLQSGKNLLDTSKIYQHSVTQVMLGQKSSRNHWETFLKAGTYTISTSTSINANVLISRKSIGSSSTSLGNTNKFLTVVLDIDDWCEFFVYKSSGITITDIISFQLEVNQTATSYEPYHGSTTNYEFGVLGKNKFNWDVEQGHASPITSDYTTARSYPLNTYIIGMSSSNYYRDNYTNWVLNPSVSNGTISFSSGGANGYGIGYPLKLMPNQTYFLSGETTNNGLAGAIYYDKDGALISTQGNRLNETITIPDNTVTTMIIFYASTTNTSYTFSNIQLELGSTATAYEPYDPKHTVYGGWVDLITGEVNETNIVYTGGWVQYAESNGYKRYELTNILLGDKNNLQNISNITTLFSNISSSTKDNRIQPVSQGSASIRAYLSLDENISVDSIQYGYKLATPNTYYLTPTSMQTFLGQNNVWSNADYVEVEYDLHETQDILARKQFIIANQPHIVKSAAAPLQNFVTDLAVPLKECKVHFSPVQEGEGDPSPENVRTITGWTGVEVYRTGNNLFNKDTAINNSWIRAGNLSEENPLGTIKENASGYALSQYILVHPNTTYTIKYNITSLATAAGMVFFSKQDANSAISGIPLYYQTYINSATTREYYTFTTPTNCHYIRISTPPNASEVQLELGSTATDYEPYNGATIPITFPTEAGTVYGGYVDLVKGEIVQEYYKAIFDGAKYFNVDNVGTKTARALISLSSAGLPQAYISGSRGQICMFNYIHGSMNTNDPWNGYISSANNVVLRISSEYSDKELWKNYLISHHLEIVYKLATPITYQIGPTTLKTLRNTNNIWSTANGDIELAYWTH